MIQPASAGSQIQTVVAGQSATFTAAVTGTGPFSYQWYRNGAAIVGATAKSYTVKTTGNNNGDVFTVAVSNAAGTVMSNQFMLTVLAPPTIVTQPQSQTVTVGQTASFTVAATGTAPLSYQWFENGAQISGATNASLTTPAMTTGNSGAQFSVTVSNTAGSATSATATLTVQLAATALAFAPISSKTFGAAPFTVSAGSASNGAITYSVVSGPATISGNTVTITGAGTVVLMASEAAAGNDAAATTTASFPVGAETPTLAFAPIASKTPGAAPFPVSAGSASNGSITYSVVSGPATISGNAVTVTGVGTVVLQASQAAAGNYAAATANASFTVGTVTPMLAFAPISSKTAGAAPFPVSASSASSGAITYSVVSGPATISGNTVSITGVGTVVLQASQAAAGNYAAATATASFAVGSLTPTLAFAPIAAQTYGNAPFVVSAISASSGAVTYSLVNGPATVSSDGMVTLTGAGPVEIMASQAASGNYGSATVTTTFTVAGETPTIAFPSPGTQAYSPQPFAVNATSNSPGTITYSVVSGAATISGNMVTMTGSGQVVLMASQAASGPFGTGSATASFTITATNPQITAQPVSENICAEQALTLSVTAMNATSYQWFFNGTAISGATAPSYSISTAIAADTGNYSVVVSNPTSNVTSQIATVNVGSTILTNPSNLTITQFQEGSFSVAATGSGHYTYQWSSVPFGGTPSQISGATSSLYVTPVQPTATIPGQPTSYYATVTDTTCNATLTSNQATLTVNAGNSPPTITQQPVGLTVMAGSGGTFTAAAVGSPAITYQWYVIPGGGTNEEIAGVVPQAGTLIPGAMSTTYTVPSASSQEANDQDVYYVIATNPYGSAVSQHATLAVDQGIQLQITDQPANQYVNAGQSATFSVTASSTDPLTYQWYMVPPGESAAAQNTFVLQGGMATQTTGTPNAVAIQGATGPSYTVPNTSSSQTGTVYYVVVSNGATSQVYSNTAALTVGQPTGIDSCSTGWNMLGTTTADSCSYELTNGGLDEQGEIVWPTLIATGNVQLSFTITTSNTTTTPADGFAMVLGDPSLGAALQSVGLPGEGLGAKGIPGFVLAFDDFFNLSCSGSSCFPAPFPADPSSSGNPDYLGVGRGESTLWEDPYFNVNLNLPVASGDTFALAEHGKTIAHSYVVSIVNGYMSVTMDGTQVFSGNVSVPPVAYLYLTSSTGGSAEETVISNISATVNAPSN